jgi:hypothetical protein
MTETHSWQQLSGKQTTARGGTGPEARRASYLAGDQGHTEIMRMTKRRRDRFS